jgi:2-keto-4-pentenoate hydratase
MTDHAAAADLLLKNWAATTRITELPEALRPQSRGEGYDAAAAVAARSGSTVAGWKIAATSEAGQKHINVDGPIIGRILKSRLMPEGASVTLGDNIMRVAEAEFAFGFAKDLAPRAVPYTQDEVLDAVGSLHLSIEVPDSRYVDFTKVGAAQLIADTACASWLVLGPAVDRPWRDLDLSSHAVKGLLNDAVKAEGTGRAVLGDPRKAGQFVTTGTCIVPMAVTPGDAVTIDYGVLGTISCRIT